MRQGTPSAVFRLPGENGCDGVVAIGYLRGNKTVYVQRSSGTVIGYQDVPEEVFDGLLQVRPSDMHGALRRLGAYPWIRMPDDRMPNAPVFDHPVHDRQAPRSGSSPPGGPLVRGDGPGVRAFAW